MQQNPFINRRPIDQPAEFIGRRQLAREIAQYLGAESPQSCYLVGERRIGKTSLLRFMAHKEGGRKEFRQLLPPDRYLFVYIDLALFWQFQHKDELTDTREPFFRHLFTRLHQTVQPHLQTIGQPDLAKTLHDHYAAYDQREIKDPALIVEEIDDYLYLLLEKPVEPKLTLVIMLDEVDAIIAQGFGYTLRALIGDRRLAYLLATQRRLEDIDPEGPLSPLYGMCKPIWLGLLDQEEASELVRTLAQQANHSFAPDDLDYILAVGGQHPDFLKVAAHYLFAARVERRSQDPPETWYEPIQSDLAGACLTLWRALNQEEQAAVIRLAREVGPLAVGRERALPIWGDSVVNAPTAADARLLNRLATRGYLIKDATGRVRLFSPVFADFVQERTCSGVASAPAPEPGPPPTTKLDFGDGYIAWGDHRIPVTKQESELFKYLFNRHGETCTRQELYEHVWAEGEYTAEKQGVVNIAVLRLRQTLKEHLGDRLLIESVRGEGYRLLVFDP